MLTKEAILAADDLPTETLDVPEWGGAVRVRGLNCADRDAYLAGLMKWKKVEGGKLTFDPAGLPGIKARLIQMTVLNGDGAPMFSPGEIDLIGHKAASAIDRIYIVAMRLSGLSAEAAETAEVEGKSEPAATSGSGSS